MSGSPPVPAAPVPTELWHFFSYATGVSLELPVGFERAGQDASSATYAVLDDDGRLAPEAPRLKVEVIGTFADGCSDGERQEALAGLVRGFLGADGRLISQTERTVDEEPVETVVMGQEDGAVLHLSAAATTGRLISLAARLPDEELVPALDRTVESVRFIEL